MSCSGSLYYWQVGVREHKHRHTSIASQNSIIALLPVNHHFQHTPPTSLKRSNSFHVSLLL